MFGINYEFYICGTNGKNGISVQLNNLLFFLYFKV